MNWILLNVIQALWWADVVCEAANWCLMSSHIIVLPLAKETNENIASELSGENLGEEVNVGDEGCLKDNWNVGGVEQLDWIWLLETSHLSTGETELNSETLEVNNDHHDDSGGEEVAKVGGILSIKRLLQTIKLIWFRDQKVEGSDDGAFEFGSLISSNGNWRE
jgi:hypothetical protein